MQRAGASSHHHGILSFIDSQENGPHLFVGESMTAPNPAGRLQAKADALLRGWAVRRDYLNVAITTDRASLIRIGLPACIFSTATLTANTEKPRARPRQRWISSKGFIEIEILLS